MRAVITAIRLRRLAKDRSFLEHDERAGAVRCAFWLAFVLINDGQWAVAGGWLTRARRLLDGAASSYSHAK